MPSGSAQCVQWLSRPVSVRPAKAATAIAVSISMPRYLMPPSSARLSTSAITSVRLLRVRDSAL